MRHFGALALALAGAGLGLFACGESISSVCDLNGACLPGPGDGSSEDGPKGDGGGDAPPGCDLSMDPKDSPSCVDTSVGVFVDHGGNDTNDGSKAMPVATITKGLDLAKTRGVPRIYVCEGTYAEDVTIDSGHDGVSVYGGFKCGAWSYSGNQPIVGKTQKPFKLDSLSKTVVIEDIEVDAQDGITGAPSSVAMFINGSSNVVLKRVRLTAGKGFQGASGSTVSNYTAVLQSDPSIAGKDGMGLAGGAPHGCALCTDGKNSTGGAGGAGGAAPGDGTAGTPILGGIMPLDGKGGHAKPSADCTGHDGPDGDAGAPAPTPASLGTLDATGWLGAAGAGGANGGPAQGGGGGGGGIGLSTGGGAGGGCGGCAGGGGLGGGAGGASTALAVLGSTVSVVSSALVAKDAGGGGTGAGGQPGQAGGFTGTQSNPGCLGGTGGTGGLGGGGAGGAGGISVGVLWKGSMPNLDSESQANIKIGMKGTKGTGGVAGTNDGPDGIATAVLSAP